MRFRTEYGCGGPRHRSRPSVGRTSLGERHRRDSRVIYDDRPIEDYTKTFPVHREFDAPARTVAITDEAGTEGFLSPAQLCELKDAGWKIMAYTVDHCALDEVGVTRNVAVADGGALSSAPRPTTVQRIRGPSVGVVPRPPVTVCAGHRGDQKSRRRRWVTSVAVVRPTVRRVPVGGDG